MQNFDEKSNVQQLYLNAFLRISVYYIECDYFLCLLISFLSYLLLSISINCKTTWGRKRKHSWNAYFPTFHVLWKNKKERKKKEKRNYFSFQEHLIPKQILTTVRASASLSNLFFCWKKNRKKKERKTIKKVRNKDLGRESMKVLMGLYQTMWK